jgi:polysaccharide pyruvyl transferase CsaB
MPLTVGIAGSYGGLNAGDEAILAVAIRELRQQIPGVRLVVFSREPSHTRQHHQVDQVVAGSEVGRSELATTLRELDLLLLGGGGLLYDRESEGYLHLARSAQKLGVRTATYAIGAGPLERAADRDGVARVLNRMSLITVREATARRLLEEIGVEEDVVVTADPALLLEPGEFTEEMLAREGLDGRARLVGVSVRERGGAAADVADRDFHELMATAADFICERFDAHAVFVPMERQDMRESHRVIASMAQPERATVLRGTYDPMQLRALVSHFHMAVGMRLHFLLFAACAGVPVAPLPYATKVRSFLDSIGVSSDLAAAGHPGTLLASIDRLWDLRDRQVAEVARRLPGLRDAAGRTAKLTAELCAVHAAA